MRAQKTKATEGGNSMSMTNYIRETVGFSCLVAWLAYFVNFAFIESSSLQMNSLFLVLIFAAVALCVVIAATVFSFMRERSASKAGATTDHAGVLSHWMYLLRTSFLKAFCESKVICIIAAVVGLVAQVVFVLYGESTVRTVCFVFAICAVVPLVVKWCNDLAGASLLRIVGFFVCGIFAAGVVYGIMLLLAFVLGSTGNVEVRMTAGLFVCSILPLVSALLTKGSQREIVTKKAPTLLGMSLMFVTWAMFFLAGFMCSPYWANPLDIFDNMGIIFAVVGIVCVGVFLCIYWIFVGRHSETLRETGKESRKEKHANRASFGMYVGTVILCFVMAIASIVMSFLFGGSSHVSLAVLLFTCTLILSFGILVAGLNVGFPGGFAALYVSVAFICQFLGIVVRRQVGVDFFTASSVILIIVLVLLGVYALLTVLNMRFLRRGNIDAGLRIERPSFSEAEIAGAPAEDIDVDTAKSSIELARTRYLEQFNLSERELEIALLFVEGNTMAEAAEACKISVNTVRYHMKSLYVKMGVQSKGDLKRKVATAVGGQIK